MKTKWVVLSVVGAVVLILILVVALNWTAIKCEYYIWSFGTYSFLSSIHSYDSLLDMGPAAIPYLISAMEDAREAKYEMPANPARLKNYYTVGDVCADILGRITNRHLSYPSDLSGQEQQKLVGSWWQWWDQNKQTVIDRWEREKLRARP